MAPIKAVVQVLLLSIRVQAHDGHCSKCSGGSDGGLLLLQANMNKRKVSGNSSDVILWKEETSCFQTGAQQPFSMVDTKVATKTLRRRRRRKASSDCDWNPQSVQDLAGKYNDIFAKAQHNRNAASHLWANFIIQRSACLSHDQIVHMFGGFCAVSGSPLGEPSPANRFKQELGFMGGGTKVGYSYHCCWPCFCDEKDHIKVDTKTLKDKSGTEKQYFFEVIGNPCQDSPAVCTSTHTEGCIPAEAPGVKCRDGKLKDAILSDKGHPIIGMFFTDSAGIKDSISGDEKKMESDDGSKSSLNDACSERKKSGMKSGMGTIFVNVAKLNPL